MPSTRNVRNESPSLLRPVSSQTGFKLPRNRHLLITTPKKIYAWDATGIRTVFESSKGSIVAAREAKDGSGVLAVAGENIVVLHDTKRKQEQSWGLSASQVCHLEYSADARSLFLSTKLTGAIQHYSIEHSKLLSPTQLHASAPVALALSPTSDLLLSASGDPPVIFLKNLVYSQPPLLVEPTASSTTVTFARFHPERSDVFLVAFRDGTVAAYDLNRITQREINSYANQERVNGCELSHFRHLHHPSMTGGALFGAHASPMTVAGAAFLPGFKSRAVTIGSDGRCKLVDFANKGVVLRTWHSKLPLTSISVLDRTKHHRALDSKRGSYRTPNARSVANEDRESTESLIAIGCAQGNVQIYDQVGLLLMERSIGLGKETILSVEWACGPAPRALRQLDGKQPANNTSIAAAGQLPRQTTSKSKPTGSMDITVQLNPSARRESTGLPPTLKKRAAAVQTPISTAPRKFTIHPDETELGTVRHTPSSKGGEACAEFRLVDQYHDLFSPPNISTESAAGEPRKRIASPPRTRPRLSSQTFIKSPEPVAIPENGSIRKPRNLALFLSTESHASSSSLEKNRQVDRGMSQRKSQPRKIVPESTPNSRRIKAKPTVTFAMDATKILPQVETIPSVTNASLLAGHRNLSTNERRQHDSGIPSVYTNPRILNRELPQSPRSQASISYIRPRADRAGSVHVGRLETWPTDSVTSSSLADAGNDIWITSESDQEPHRQCKRSLGTDARSPARAMSRSNVGTAERTAIRERPPRSDTSGTALHEPPTDGSMDEAMFSAQTHISPEGTFSPGSEDVRDLFPRSSSLSPRREGNKDQKGAAESKQAPLTEREPNAVLQSQPKSPWARAKAGKSSRTLETQSQLKRQPQRLADCVPLPCVNCTDMRVKLHTLEADVIQLKGEVLALKAVLQRNGLPFPACLR